MSNRPTLVLVDFSNLAQTCFHPAIAAYDAGEKAWQEHVQKCQACSTAEGTGSCNSAPKRYIVDTVYRENLNLKVGTLTEALQIPVTDFVMVKDSKPVARYERYPEYKAGRKRDDRFGDPRPAAEAFFIERGCRFVQADKYEADDCIAALAGILREKFDIIIVSSDKDLWQLIDPPQVRIYGPVLKDFISPERIKKSFPDRSKTSPVEGIDDPKHIRLCKALWGDSGDNIPNVMPRTQAALTPLIKSSDGTLENFVRSVRESIAVPDKVKSALAQNLKQVETNYFLAGLFDDCEVKWL